MDARERLKQYLASLEEPKKETNQALLENQTSLLKNLKQQVEDSLKETAIQKEPLVEQETFHDAVDESIESLKSQVSDQKNVTVGQFSTNQQDVKSVLESLPESEPKTFKEDEESLEQVVENSVYTESTEDVRIREKESKKKWSLQSVIDFVRQHNVAVTTTFLVTVVLGTLTFRFLMHQSNVAAKNNKEAISGQVTRANKKAVAELSKASGTKTQRKQKKSLEEQFKTKLEQSAKSLGLDYQIDVHELIAGYLVGTVTYHPKDTSKKYVDVSLQVPEKKAAQDTSDAGKAVHDRLVSALPTINETIKVKDAKKVTVETYKNGENGFISILLYNKKPFGYVTTDKQNIDTNTVTSYYVSDVMAN